MRPPPTASLRRRVSACLARHQAGGKATPAIVNRGVSIFRSQCVLRGPTPKKTLPRVPSNVQRFPEQAQLPVFGPWPPNIPYVSPQYKDRPQRGSSTNFEIFVPP